jgi:hypothetical protein
VFFPVLGSEPGARSDMAEEDRNDDTRVRQHVSKILAMLSAFMDRLRAQEKAGRAESSDTTVEVKREDHTPSGINRDESPS